MKRLFTLLLFSTLIISSTFAQQHPNVEDMHARKWSYIVDKISLNADQISKVKPIFLEYEKAGWEVMEQNHKTFKKLNENKNTNEKVNFKEINDEYVELEMKKAQQLKNYYSKLQKVLPAETIYAYFRAERSFRRDLLKKIDENRRMKRQNK